MRMWCIQFSSVGLLDVCCASVTVFFFDECEAVARQLQIDDVILWVIVAKPQKSG